MFIYIDKREEWVYIARSTSNNVFKNRTFFHILDGYEDIMLNQEVFDASNIYKIPHYFLEHFEFSDIKTLYELIEPLEIVHDKVYELNFRSVEVKFRVLFFDELLILP